MSKEELTTKTTTCKVNCPTCKISVIWNEQSSYRPFCSKRCQQIDFGEWASESFSIPGTPSIIDPSDMDLIEEDGETRH
ncbi:MAG: DNA gyrase inhibitor YacG [Porticoccus sp.]|nr:DNA gyrase inhibitor YacG [Porticoccus sp.]